MADRRARPESGREPAAVSPVAPLTPLPGPPLDRAGRLLAGRWAGPLTVDPLRHGPRAGRARRWHYAAAADDRGVVGAAVVDLGALVVGFAFAVRDGRTVTVDGRGPKRTGQGVAATPDGGARLATRRLQVTLDGAGGLRFEGTGPRGRLSARVEVAAPVTPAVLVTDTPAGGFNATQKVAGHAAQGTVATDGDAWHLRDAGGFADWTSGRQDRRTRWRWLAGALRSDDGALVGVNASTGMNAGGPGEDVVWWGGRPHGLALDALAPVVADQPRGRWAADGPGWELDLQPWGHRAADERLPGMRSWYVQPAGALTGALPGSDGAPRRVTGAGVCEDHLAVW